LEWIASVHELKPIEIEDDRYGFAREFVCWLLPGTTTTATLETLQRSPLIRRALPLLIRKPY
ncbi:MAG: hypothetical protein V3T83_09720, partial [Acidobacteriota bacterium]